MFFSFVVLPLQAQAATTGMNWSDKSTPYKLNSNTMLDPQVLTAVVGCTGIVNKVAKAVTDFVAKETTKILKLPAVKKQVQKAADKVATKLKIPIVSDLVGDTVPVTDSSTQDKIDTANDKTDHEIKTNECLKGIAYSLAKTQLVNMTQATMNWVNSGFSGNPVYVQDMHTLTNSLEKNIVDKETTFFQDPSNALNYPYGRSFALGQINAQKQADNVHGALIQTLSNYLSGDGTSTQSINNFANDFSVGGWGGWLALTQIPQNNPLGFNMLAADAIDKQKGEAVTNKKAEVAAAGGLQDQKKCVAFGLTKTAAINSAQSKISNLEVAKLKNTLDAATASRDKLCANAPILTSPAGIKCSAAQDVYKQAADAYATTGFVDQSQTPDQIAESLQNAAASGQSDKDCTKWEVVTPGSIIKDKISTYVNSPERQLELANDINSILFNAFSNMINSLRDNGIKGLSSSPTDLANAQNNTVGGTTNDGNYNSVSSTFDITKDLQGVIDTQKSYITEVNASLAVASRATIMPLLGELDYCIPGPNPNWETNSGAKDAYLSYLDGINVTERSQTVGGFTLRLFAGVVGASGLDPAKGNINLPDFTDYSNLVTAWDELKNGPFFQGLFNGFSNIYDNSVEAAQSHVDKVVGDTKNDLGTMEADYTEKINATYGTNSPMLTELLVDKNTGNVTENSAYLPMAQAGLAITKDIKAYDQGLFDAETEYQTRINEARANSYELKKISDSVDAIIKAAQARRDAARAASGAPAITAECKASEVINFSSN